MALAQRGYWGYGRPVLGCEQRKRAFYGLQCLAKLGLITIQVQSIILVGSRFNFVEGGASYSWLPGDNSVPGVQAMTVKGIMKFSSGRQYLGGKPLAG